LVSRGEPFELPKRFDLLTYVKTPSSVDCVFGGFGGWEGFGLVFEEREIKDNDKAKDSVTIRGCEVRRARMGRAA
jgi:hypothetical protein